jgi:hypothetical protein
MQTSKNNIEETQTIEEQFEKDVMIGATEEKTKFHHQEQQNEDEEPLINLCRVCGSPGNISIYTSPPEKLMCIKPTPESKEEEELTIATMISKIANEKVRRKKGSSDKILNLFKHSRLRRQTHCLSLYAHSALVTSSTHLISDARLNRQQKTLN